MGYYLNETEGGGGGFQQRQQCPQPSFRWYFQPCSPLGGVGSSAESPKIQSIPAYIDVEGYCTEDDSDNDTDDGKSEVTGDQLNGMEKPPGPTLPSPMPMLYLLLVSVVPLVTGHGGMLWPPAWQDGKGVSLNKIADYMVSSDPVVVDPASGRGIKSIKSWLTDQAYLGGHGDQFLGVGNITNPECFKKNFCIDEKTPWAAPGSAPSLGGGCGIFGGNPYGCPSGNDTRAPGSVCGQYKQPRGTFTFGSSALDVEFPQALTTEWALGSRQDVAWVGKGGHWGGYTYRLCKMPLEGKTGITEECFAQNVLKFATPYTRMRQVDKPGKWKKVKQEDLTEGTYPPGSAWRHVAVKTKEGQGILRKDSIVVPTDLPVGDYVLSFRWDTVAPQIWVSCANIRLTMATIG